jgi:flagellar basal body rod protein FlgC
MISPVSIALSGLNAASTKVATAANNIATKQNETLDRDIIDIRIAENDYKANLAVLKVAGEMERELLNQFDETV